MYNAWLVYDEEGAKKNQDYIQWHMTLGKEYGISFQLKIIKEQWKVNSEVMPDFAIVRTIQPDFSETLGKLGVPVFNSAFVSRICNHKGKTIDYVQKNTSVPVIRTISFSREKLNPELLEKFPNHVIKSVDGHGGRQVFRTDDNWEQIREGIGTSDFIIQPFVPGEGKDVRIYVIGNEVAGAVQRRAKDGFKSNFSLGGQVETYHLKEKEMDYVRQICRIFDFGMVGIDFIIDEKESFLFNEIEDVVGARMLYQCQPEVKLLERYFTFITEKMLQCR
jgi:RimK family alpha-L-glutamate ligase